MLRAYVMQQPSKWEDYLHLVEFSYKNGYHTSLWMSPFEVLYGRKCMTPLSWSGLEDKLMLGRDMLEEIEKMVKSVQNNLKASQDWKNNFVDRKRSFREFKLGEHVYIQVRAKKSTL